MRFSVVLAFATLAACSGKKQPEAEQQQLPAVGTFVRGDAGITSEVLEVDPTERHIDEGAEPRPSGSQPSPSRQGRPIDVTLRSTPPGAQVAVDGTVIGNTPSFWSGTADGREHEFVFTMRGYAIARYRFVPIASGVIHGRLDPIREESDAGVPAPPPEVVPPRPHEPPSMHPPAPPTTVITDAPTGSATGSATAPGSATPVGPQP